MKFLVAFLAICAVAYAYVAKLDDRIVGGQVVNIRDYPYQVSVRIDDMHICGGSIIKDDIILTAGHCVHDTDYSQFSVRVGNNRHSQGISHIVSEVRLHHSYDPDTVDNDMAILKLEKPISFNTNAQPVVLQPEGENVVAGTISWVSGWGSVSRGSDVLRAVDLAVITNDQCSKKYGDGEISSHMMCAQTLFHDSCQGDSGGPLVASGKLIGVVSWGYGCAKPKYPGVYANVSDMHSWILDNKY